MIAQRLLQVENTKRQQAHAIAKHTEELTRQGYMMDNADKIFKDNLSAFEATKVQ